MELFKKLLLAATVAIVTGNASAMRHVTYQGQKYVVDSKSGNVYYNSGVYQDWQVKDWKLAAVVKALGFVKAHAPTLAGIRAHASHIVHADLRQHLTGRNAAGLAGFVVPCCVGCTAEVCAAPAACCVLCGCATGCACACQKGYDMVAAHVHAPVAPSMPK